MYNIKKRDVDDMLATSNINDNIQKMYAKNLSTRFDGLQVYHMFVCFPQILMLK